MYLHPEDKSPERHSIHGNSPSPVRHRGNMDIVMPNTNIDIRNQNAKRGQNMLGNNIDGLPLQNNRSPPRNSGGSSSGGSLKDQGSPNQDVQGPNYLN